MKQRVYCLSYCLPNLAVFTFNFQCVRIAAALLRCVVTCQKPFSF